MLADKTRHEALEVSQDELMAWATGWLEGLGFRVQGYRTWSWELGCVTMEAVVHHRLDPRWPSVASCISDREAQRGAMDTLDSLVAGCGGPRWGWTVSWDPDVERIQRDRTAHRNGVPAVILPLVARYEHAPEVEVAHRPGRPLGDYPHDPIQRWLGDRARIEDMDRRWW
jgi:hypothetical protein